MTGDLIVALAALVAIAGWRVRHRLRHHVRSGVTDETGRARGSARTLTGSDLSGSPAEEFRTQAPAFLTNWDVGENGRLVRAWYHLAPSLDFAGTSA